ncbi:MAG: hypothetical protein KIT87_27485 [Anaerolineae bacterium]|nr:hypothetical protein [Anaerolineae bacterium]
MKKYKQILVLAALSTGFLALGGCEKPLFPEDMPRSPYERYQVLRGQQRTAVRENTFGGKEPAIRERLRPLGEP